jgi:hypothetical protein
MGEAHSLTLEAVHAVLFPGDLVGGHEAHELGHDGAGVLPGVLPQLPLPLRHHHSGLRRGFVGPVRHHPYTSNNL